MKLPAEILEPINSASCLAENVWEKKAHRLNEWRDIFGKK